MKLESKLGGEADRERVLVIRFSSLGDILLTAPTIRALRRRFPDAHMDLLVAKEYAEATALIPGCDRILTFDRATGLSGLLKLRSNLSRRYTYLVDLQNSARSAFLRATTLPTVWVKAKRYRLKRWLLVRFKWNLYRDVLPVPLRYLEAAAGLGAVDDDEGLSLRIPDLAVSEAQALLTSFNLGAHPSAILCPGARHFTKRWPADRWITLGQQFVREGYRILVIGAQNERELVQSVADSIPNAVPLAGYPVPTIAAIMQQSKVVVCNDSGLMHLATGVDAPVVAVFGPTVREFGFFPFRARSVVLEQELSCRPCSAVGSERCKEGHFRCMLDTHPGQVIAAAQRLINNG